MSKLNLIIFAVFYILHLSNCNLDIEKNIDLQKSVFFFSTEMYFQQEAERLNRKTGFTKYVDFNGEEETVELDTLNFQQEFIPFIKSDINKVIWFDQYTCDTIYQGDKGILSIKCISLNSKLKTKSLDVEFRNEEVVSVNIECGMHKMLLDTREFLSYEKDNYYQIKRIQKLKKGTVDSTLVRVNFRK